MVPRALDHQSKSISADQKCGVTSTRHPPRTTETSSQKYDRAWQEKRLRSPQIYFPTNFPPFYPPHLSCPRPHLPLLPPVNISLISFLSIPFSLPFPVSPQPVSSQTRSVSARCSCSVAPGTAVCRRKGLSSSRCPHSSCTGCTSPPRSGGPSTPTTCTACKPA